MVTEVGKRPITGKSDAKSRPNLGKKVNSKKTDKKAKSKKEVKKEEPKEEVKEEPPKVEEKKPVIIKPKYIINIPEEIKDKFNLCSIYFILKKNYLNKKQILYIATSNPLLYKTFGNNMKFLLDEKKNDIEKKAKDIESFLNNYGDLNTYLNKEFSMSKKAMSSLSMLKKKGEEDILKNPELPDDVGRILKCLYYLLDEKFDENLNSNQLFENMVTNIVEKNEDKTFKGLLVNYFNKNKFLNLTKEKQENINKIINENNNILTMTKTYRPISLFCFLLKEIYDYINLKTSDNHYYYELREKNAQLQKYLDFIYLYDNNGKERNPPKEEKIKEQTKNEEIQKEEKPKEENVEKNEEQKEETQNINEEKPKEEVEEKNDEKKKEKGEIKTEENKVEEESVKKEEEPQQN